jgi:uncharacterized protein YxeA
MKKKIIIWSVIGLVIISVASGLFIQRRINYRNNYLYMPKDYVESEVFFPKWEDVTKPIRLEITNDGWDKNYYFIDEEEDVMFVIEELQKSSYVSRSRGEFEELSFTNVSKGYDDGFQVVIRTMQNETDGAIIFMFTMYEDEEYVYSNRPYYYYTVSDELREYIINTFN